MRKRIITLISTMILIAFIAGVLANPVLVQRIQPISSSETKVGGAHLQILDVVWVVDNSSSTVEGVILTVNNTDTVAHGFGVVVQVSCLSSGSPFPGDLRFFPPKPFICAGGGGFTISASGTEISGVQLGPGQTARVGVNFDHAIDPERTQIEDLSFIVTEF